MAPCRVAVACRVPCRARCSRMPGAMSGTFGRCSRMRHMIDYRLVVRRKRRKRHSVSSACPMSHLPRRSTVDCAGRSRTCAQTLYSHTASHRPARNSQRGCSDRVSRRCPVTTLYWFVCGLLTSRARLTEGEECVESRTGPRSRWLEAHSILIRLGPSRTSRTDEAAERCRLHGRRPLSLEAARDGAFFHLNFAQNNANLLRKHAQNDAFGHPRRGGLWHRRHAPRCRKGAPREKGVLRTDGRTRGCGT